MVFWVKTADDTAKVSEKDYDALNQMVLMKRGQKETTVKVSIHDDEIWEPDKDFFVELYEDEDSPERMEGDDTQTKITILDEDNPGTIGFEVRHQKVKKKDGFAYITITRNDGADGAIQCMCRTEVLPEVNNQASEFTDFLPFKEKLKFEHGETEKKIKV